MFETRWEFVLFSAAVLRFQPSNGFPRKPEEEAGEEGDEMGKEESVKREGAETFSHSADLAVAGSEVDSLG